LIGKYILPGAVPAFCLSESIESIITAPFYAGARSDNKRSKTDLSNALCVSDTRTHVLEVFDTNTIHLARL